MKLKKIASLVLAGVMAVSMLAACGDNGNSGSSSSEPVVPGDTTIASEVNANLYNDVKEKITFTDSSDLLTIMNDYFEKNDLALTEATSATNTAPTAGASSTSASKIVEKVQNKLGVKVSTGFNTIDVNTDKVAGTNDTSAVEVYILKSNLEADVVAKLVATRINTLNLYEEDEDKVVDYNYTGSVAVTKAETEGGTESAWVVAVVINKDVVKK